MLLIIPLLLLSLAVRLFLSAILFSQVSKYFIRSFYFFPPQLLVSFLPLRGLLPSNASISAMRGGVSWVRTYGDKDRVHLALFCFIKSRHFKTHQQVWMQYAAARIWTVVLCFWACYFLWIYFWQQHFLFIKTCQYAALLGQNDHRLKALVTCNCHCNSNSLLRNITKKSLLQHCHQNT